MARLRQSVMRKFSLWNRRRKAAFIASYLTQHGLKSLLFVGAGRGAGDPTADAVERSISHLATTIVALNVQPTASAWPFVCADGRFLPFRDGSFDLVLSNAVVEHVGGLTDQHQFVAEHVRVGRRWVMTTPNRWFPVESHTLVLIKHWFPYWRRRQDVFTRLLSRREFAELLPKGTRLQGSGWSPTFTAFSHLTHVERPVVGHGREKGFNNAAPA